MERQHVPVLKYNLTRLAGVGAVGEVGPVLLEPVDQGSLGMLCIMVAKAVGGGEELALLPALGALHQTLQSRCPSLCSFNSRTIGS